MNLKMMVLASLAFLAACAPAQSIQVTDGPPVSVQNTVAINGIAVQEFTAPDGYGWVISNKLQDRLSFEGFRVYDSDAWQLEEKARILITGRIEKFVNANGDELDRIQFAEVFIRDLGDRSIIKTITVPRARIAWDAPRTEDFLSSVVNVVLGMYRPDDR